MSSYCTVPEWSLERIAYMSPVKYVTDDEQSRAGKPGAWRNISSRCSHGVERSATRCYQCDPLHNGERPKLQRSAQHCPRKNKESLIPVPLAKKRIALQAIHDGADTFESLGQALGLDDEQICITVRRLRAQHLVSSRESSRLLITARGMAVMRGERR